MNMQEEIEAKAITFVKGLIDLAWSHCWSPEKLKHDADEMAAIIKQKILWLPEVMNASQSTEPQWQPIATAPKDGTRVLIVNQDGLVDVAGYIEQWCEYPEFVRAAKDGDVYKVVREDSGYWDTDIAYCPIFWMPLPAAPAQTESE